MKTLVPGLWYELVWTRHFRASWWPIARGFKIERTLRCYAKRQWALHAGPLMVVVTL